MAESIHQGRNVKRFCEMPELKQEGLAYELGEDWNQKEISLLKSKETVSEVLPEQVAKVLRAEFLSSFLCPILSRQGEKEVKKM